MRWVTTWIYRASCALINGFWCLVRLMMHLVVRGADPQFVCRTSDVSSDVEGDALVKDSVVNYTIRDIIDDGTGMTTLMLEAD